MTNRWQTKSFLGFFTARVGTIILSSCGFTICLVIFVLNTIEADRLPSFTSWSYVFFAIWAVPSLLGYFIAMTGALSDNKRFLIKSLELLIFALLYWLILCNVVLLGHRSGAQKYICIGERCPQRMWMLEPSWLGEEPATYCPLSHSNIEYRYPVKVHTKGIFDQELIKFVYDEEEPTSSESPNILLSIVLVTAYSTFATYTILMIFSAYEMLRNDLINI